MIKNSLLDESQGTALSLIHFSSRTVTIHFAGASIVDRLTALQ